MELFFLLIGLFFVVTFFMPWVNFSRFGSLRDDILLLRRRVETLEKQLKNSGQTPIKEEVQKAPVKAAAIEHPPEVKKDNRPGAVPKTSTSKNMKDYIHTEKLIDLPDVTKIKESFEKNIATKLPVWIGAISLIFAAFFLVKYSIELGWMKPSVRLLLGALFGASLVAVGQWVAARGHIANHVRISQGLVGAGLVALYVAVYAAINLYGLIPPMIGFGCMAAITAAAVILSVRHGQPIAIFGLLGGLITPALIQSDAPNAIALFSYLFLLFAFMFMILVRQGWWLLAIAAVIGVFCWSIFWFVLIFAAADAFVLLVFAMAVAFVVMAVTGKRIVEENISDKEKTPIHGLNFTAIAGAVMTIVWLSMEITLSLFEWSMLGLLSMALIALSAFQPAIYKKPLWVKLGGTLILYFFWAMEAPTNDAIAVLLGLALIYVGGGALVMRQVSDPRYWSAVQVIAGLALYVMGYYALDIEPFPMFWGAVALAMAALSIWGLSDIYKKYHADAVIREHLLAIYLLAASAFIALGLSLELPWQYVPLAIAGQIGVTALIFEKTKIGFLQNIMMILAFVFAAMNYEQVILFATNIVGALFDENISSSYLRRTLLDVPALKLGLPALLMLGSLWVVIRSGAENKKAIHALFGVAFVCVLATAYYMIKEFLHPTVSNSFFANTGFIERGVITMALAGSGVLLIEAAGRFNLSFVKIWAHGLFLIAVARFAYFDLFLLNPYWDSAQNVGHIPIFNGVTLTYGGGLLLCAWGLMEKLKPGAKFYQALGLLALFALVTFTVRQFFHGGRIVEGSISSAELYSYSVAWLLTGLALLGVGIQKENKPARMVSLGFIVLAIIKVFLFDAAELEGLYRVFSFLGLGVSLIGLSYFYTKFVFAAEQAEKKS